MKGEGANVGVVKGEVCCGCYDEEGMGEIVEVVKGRCVMVWMMGRGRVEAKEVVVKVEMCRGRDEEGEGWSKILSYEEGDMLW